MPPPSPTPVPAPSPTQTVLVNLPPELVHKLASPDDHWWAQPAATMGAAGIALLAAAVALFGVWLQVRQAHKNARRAALAEAYASAWELLRAFSLTREANDREVATDYAKAFVAALNATGQLIVLGKFKKTVTAMKELTTGATEEAKKSSPVDGAPSPLIELVERVEKAIKAAKV